ncbi:rhomboid-related protein 4-like [Heterodontus francisci]|uniref:rhomboid-related protein 4-like n=1 Tax=Heterodontus francisci TaxID=7792 RepID=UPI00355C20C6
MEELLGSYIIFIILLFIETKGIPPITLAIIILNMFIFLAPELNVAEVCLSVHTTFYACEWQRLVLAPLHHIDIDHLGFNMASLVWKGSKMERRVGSARFVFSTLIFGILTGVTYLSIKAALACLLTERFNMDCAVGFSGILFALKVINNGHSADGDIPGPFQIKKRDACWAELVLIHLLSPRSSFVGHLAGILVGLAYVKGPLKIIINWFTGKEYGNVRFAECCHHSRSLCLDEELDRGGLTAGICFPAADYPFFGDLLQITKPCRSAALGVLAVQESPFPKVAGGTVTYLGPSLVTPSRAADPHLEANYLHKLRATKGQSHVIACRPRPG